MKALWEVWEQKRNGRFRVRLVRDRPTPTIFVSPAYARLATAGLLAALAGREPILECHVHPEGGFWASLWWDGNRRSTVIGDHVVVLEHRCSREQPVLRANSSILPGGLVRRDARVEIVKAFEYWHREHGGPLIPALKEWCALYRALGADVSEETRAVIPSIAWNTLQRHRRKWLDGGNMALLPGKGGRKSTIDADPNMRALVEAQLNGDPKQTTARHVQRALAMTFPTRIQPSIASVRRFIRRWHMERSEDRWKPS